jgi:hypothetical protein
MFTGFVSSRVAIRKRRITFFFSLALISGKPAAKEEFLWLGVAKRRVLALGSDHRAGMRSRRRFLFVIRVNQKSATILNNR